MDEKEKQEYLERKAEKVYKILKDSDVGRQIKLGIELYSQHNPLDLEAVKIANERIKEERKAKFTLDEKTQKMLEIDDLSSFTN